MTSVPILEDEPGRLAALQRLEILDTEAEEPFEHVVSLVRSVLNVPIAAVSLVDADRQWSSLGLASPPAKRRAVFRSARTQSWTQSLS